MHLVWKLGLLTNSLRSHSFQEMDLSGTKQEDSLAPGTHYRLHCFKPTSQDSGYRAGVQALWRRLVTTQVVQLHNQTNNGITDANVHKII